MIIEKKKKTFPHSNDVKSEVQVLPVVFIDRADRWSWWQA